MRSDATAPISWEDAMWQAEDACALKLAEVMGLKPKNDIFTGIKSDNAVDCAVFDIGKPETGDQFGYVADHFHFRGQVDLYSRDRRQIMKWVMRIFGSMPMHTCQATEAKLPNSNVECFRVQPVNNCMNVITTVEIPVGKIADNRKVEVFTTSVFFDIVFFGGQRVAPI